MKQAFSIIELLIVLGITATLLALSSTRLFTLQNSAYLNSTVSSLVSDIKRQQLQAMTGNTQGATQNINYGIYFETNRYILFHGASYIPEDPTNFAINLETNIRFTNILFPQSQLIFSKGSGEVDSFTNGNNSVQIENINTGDKKVIEFNRLGIITAIN